MWQFRWELMEMLVAFAKEEVKNVHVRIQTGTKRMCAVCGRRTNVACKTCGTALHFRDNLLGSMGPFVLFCVLPAMNICQHHNRICLFFVQCTLSLKSIPWNMLTLGKSAEQKLIGE